MTHFLPSIVLNAAEKFSDKLAIADPWTTLTYEALANQMLNVASGLQQLPLEKQSRVAISLANSSAFIANHFGIMASGHISVPCEYMLSVTSFDAICHSAKPRVLLTDAKTLTRLATSHALNEIEYIYLVDDNTQITDKKAKHITTLYADTKKWIQPKGQDILAALMYTTGSTGAPKGVMLTHQIICTAMQNIQSFIQYTEHDSEVIILPLTHSFGIGHVYGNLNKGATVYTEHGLTRVKRVLNKLVEYQATGFPGTPMGYGLLIDNYADIFKEKAKHLRFAVINSAPLPPQTTKKIRALLPNLNVMVYYGLTEASRSTFISLSEKGPDFYRSVGKTFDNLSLKIMNDAGDALPVNETGLVTISGPTVTQGYWNMAKETETLFLKGQMLTGDIGYLDAQGYLFITGRVNDIINVGGFKFCPDEIENILLKQDMVREVAVVGIQQDHSEAVYAVIIPQEKAEINVDTLMQVCTQTLEKFKVPSHYILATELPRSSTGKIKRSELKDWLKTPDKYQLKSIGT